MNIRLIRPEQCHKESAIDFKNEFIENGEKIINGSEMLDCIQSYDEWLLNVTNNADPEKYNKDWVLTDTYFAIDENDTIIGIADFRHELKGFLVDFGNCGYSVKPSERCKGYATEILSLIKERAKECGFNSISLSVEKSNIPSVKTIKKNGGVYERSFEYEGETADVYKISL